MITLKRSSSDERLEVSSALMSVKNQTDFQKEEYHETTYQCDKENRLRQLIVKAKMKKIQYAFIQKLMRRVDTDDQIMLKIWKNEEERQISKPAIEGMVYPEEFEHILEVLNLLCFPLLIVLTSFLGFLDDFAQHYSKNEITIIIKIFCFVVIILRFVVKSTSVTFSGGEFKFYLKQIIVAYFNTNQLLFDFVLIILQLINLFFPESMVIAAILFFYLNLMMIYPGNDTIRTEAAYIQSKKTALFWALFKIIFFNLFFAHFMGTVILAMAKIEPEKSWMVRAGVEQKEWYIKYVYAYYWGTTIMMTVGFGDMLPGSENWREVIMTSFLQMFSCIVLGYNISSIGNIVSKLRDADQKINRKVVVFQRMMRRDRKKNVSINPLLEKRISNYLQELRIDKGNLEYLERDQLLSQLPENLRRQYFKQANKRIFSSVMFFNQLKPQTLQVFAQKFKSIFYTAGQYMLHQKYILILENGKVGLGYKRKGATKNGLIMEEIEVKENQSTLLLNGSEFLTFLPESKYHIISKDNCMVWSISRDDFLDTLSGSAIDIQYYFSLIHKHPIDENQWEFIQCQRCSFGMDPEFRFVKEKNKIFHTSFKCAKLTYLPIRSLTANFYNANYGSDNNERLDFKRIKSGLSKRHTFYWRKELRGENQRESISDSIKRSQKLKKKASLNRQKLVNTVAKVVQNSISEIDQLKLKRLIKEVLLQYETGYEEGYWTLQCDNVFDYQFYFPQNNPNRLNMTPVAIHPSEYEKFHRPNRAFACRLKSIVRSY